MSSKGVNNAYSGSQNHKLSSIDYLANNLAERSNTYYVIKTENIHSTYVPVGKSYGSKKHKAGHPFINNARTSVDSKVKIENTNGKLD